MLLGDPEPGWDLTSRVKYEKLEKDAQTGKLAIGLLALSMLVGHSYKVLGLPITSLILGHAANYCNGAFREYVSADADLLIRIPDHMSFDEASTLGMGISTAAQALYQWLPLPLPTHDPQATNWTILIYGGSSATGSIAIQLAKL